MLKNPCVFLSGQSDGFRSPTRLSGGGSCADFLSARCQNLGLVFYSGLRCSIFIVEHFAKRPLHFEVLTCPFLAVIPDLSCNSGTLKGERDA